MTAMKPRRIGFLGYDGVTALDLVGPSEAFAPPWLTTAGRSSGLTRSRSSASAAARSRPSPACGSGRTAGLDAAARLDTLIIPGGRGLREPRINARVAAWVKQRAPRTRRVVSVCTGSTDCADGLLDGGK
jgi:putative intracellular protease/amidase